MSIPELLRKSNIPEVFETICKKAANSRSGSAGTIETFLGALKAAELSSVGLVAGKSIDDHNLMGRRAVMRVSLNAAVGSPLLELQMRSIVASVKKAVLGHCRVLLIADAAEDISFEDHARRLGEIIGPLVTLTFVPNVTELEYVAGAWENHQEVLLLENLTKLLPDDASADPKKQLYVARHFTPHADVMLWECFPQAHEVRATTTLLPRLLRDSALGTSFAAEMKTLASFAGGSTRTVLIVGGDAVKDESLLRHCVLLCEHLFVLCGPDRSDREASDGAEFTAFAERVGCVVHHPVDYSCVRDKYRDGVPPSTGRRPAVTHHSAPLPQGQFAVDVGPETMASVLHLLSGADRFVWLEPIASSSICEQLLGSEHCSAYQLIQALHSRHELADVTSIVGGTALVECLLRWELKDKVSYVSLSNEALRNVLSGKTLPLLGSMMVRERRTGA